MIKINLDVHNTLYRYLGKYASLQFKKNITLSGRVNLTVITKYLSSD